MVRESAIDCFPVYRIDYIDRLGFASCIKFLLFWIILLFLRKTGRIEGEGGVSITEFYIVVWYIEFILQDIALLRISFLREDSLSCLVRSSVVMGRLLLYSYTITRRNHSHSWLWLGSRGDYRIHQHLYYLSICAESTRKGFLGTCHPFVSPALVNIFPFLGRRGPPA